MNGAAEADQGNDPRYQLLYDEALRNLDRQATRLEELRVRATNLFSAAAVAAGFLAAEGFGAKDDPTPLALAGAAAFVITGWLLGFVLWPQEWRFTAKARDVKRMVEDDESLETIHYSLAELHTSSYSCNEPRLARSARIISLMVVAVVVEILAFVLNVVFR